MKYFHKNDFDFQLIHVQFIGDHIDRDCGVLLVVVVCEVFVFLFFSFYIQVCIAYIEVILSFGWGKVKILDEYYHKFKIKIVLQSYTFKFHC